MKSKFNVIFSTNEKVRPVTLLEMEFMKSVTFSKIDVQWHQVLLQEV